MLTENLIEETLLLYKNNTSKSIASECIKSFLIKEEFQKPFATHINKLLGLSSSRLDGFQLIIECIEEISADILLDHGLFWLKSCLSNFEYSQHKELNLEVVRNIIELTHDNLEFSKKLATEYLSRVLDAVLKDEPNLFVQRSSIGCLTSCLKYYGSYCKPHLKKIENYLVGFLESSSEELVMESAAAFIHCQKISSGGNSSNGFVDNLSLNFQKLCVTCHFYLDEIFKQWLEIESFETDGIEAFNIRNPPLHYNSYLKSQYRTQIVLNALEWLKIFLSGECNIVLSSKIFNFFERGLSIHQCSKEDCIDTKFMAFNVILIQTKILDLLNILILQLKFKVYPFYVTISELMKDLSKNRNCDCYTNCSLFQEHFHNILVNLASLVGHGLEKSLQSCLVSQIIKNNTPSENQVTVKIQANMVGKSSKSKQNLILNSINLKNKKRENKWTQKKLEVSLNSLKVLLVLVKNNYLEEDILDTITCFVVENILSLQKGNIQAPFIDSISQEFLYKILSVIFEHENPKICWKYGTTIKKLFVNGRRNENHNICVACREGLRNVEKIFETLVVDSNNHMKEYSEPENCELSENGLQIEESSDNYSGQSKIRILSNEIVVSEKKQEPLEEERSPMEIEENEEKLNEKSLDIENPIVNSNTMDVQDQGLVMEPLSKKQKIEDNIENLFSNEFNEDFE